MKKNEDFVLRQIYGKSILIPIKRNNVSQFPMYLNDVAAKILKEVDMCETKSELITYISKIYKLKENTEELASVKEFVNQLIVMGLIIEE